MKQDEFNTTMSILRQMPARKICGLRGKQSQKRKSKNQQENKKLNHRRCVGDRGRGDGDRGSSGGAVLCTQTSPSSPKCSSTKEDPASKAASVVPLASKAKLCTLHV